MSRQGSRLSKGLLVNPRRGGTLINGNDREDDDS